jgi:hypothetical protein
LHLDEVGHRTNVGDAREALSGGERDGGAACHALVTPLAIDKNDTILRSNRRETLDGVCQHVMTKNRGTRRKHCPRTSSLFWTGFDPITRTTERKSGKDSIFLRAIFCYNKNERYF